MLFSSFVPPTSYNPTKFEPYECGIETIGGSWLQYTVGYYLFAIIFLVFDVETVMLCPWALAYNQLALFAVLEGAAFIAILLGGLLYAWRKGALEWL